MSTLNVMPISGSSIHELLDLGQSLILDLDRRILHWTRGCRDLYGFSSAEAIGQVSDQLLRTRYAVPLEQIHATLLRDGRWNGQLVHHHRSGRELVVASLWALHRDREGTPLAILQSNTDITELKEAQSALQASEERFRGTFESAAVGFTHTDLDGRWVRVNRKLCQTLGYTEAELVGRHFAELTHPEDREEDVQQYAMLMRGESDSYSVEKRYFHKAGHPVWVRVTRSVQLDQEGKAAYAIGVSVIEDIAARKEAEAARLASEQRLSAIIESAMDAIITINARQEIVMFNAAAEKMFGCRAAEAVGTHIARFIPESARAAHQGHVAEFAARGRSARSMGHLGDLRGRRSNGSEFPIEASISRVFAGGELLMSVILRDITEHKVAQAQLHRAKEAAELASRAKDQFLARLSHELRNPLTPVLATAAALQEDERFDADTRESFEIIRRNVELEALLIDDLLDVTRITRGKVELHRQLLDVSTVVKHAVEVCRRDIDARHLTLDLSPPAGPCAVFADPVRLQQVLWNLLTNAVKFTPEGGSIRVQWDCDEKEAWVCVSDTGMGIEPDMLARIFEAFDQGAQGTTRQFGGLGLGLTISRALAMAHGGTLEAHSEGKGKGARFTLRLPLAAADALAGSSATGAGNERAPLRSLRILLVEDHVDTAHVMRRLLSRRGHKVEHAADLRQAMEIIRREPGFDLLLSDLGLPDGSGLDLMRELRASGHTLPSIALSGYGQEQDLELARQAGFSAHLTKPVTLQQLLEAMGSLLQQQKQ